MPKCIILHIVLFVDILSYNIIAFNNLLFNVTQLNGKMKFTFIYLLFFLYILSLYMIYFFFSMNKSDILVQNNN